MKKNKDEKQNNKEKKDKIYMHTNRKRDRKEEKRQPDRQTGRLY